MIEWIITIVGLGIIFLLIVVLDHACNGGK